MKIKQAIYFGCMVLGFGFLLASGWMVPGEIYLAIGIVLLMFGVYGTSKSWTQKPPEDEL